MVSLIQTKSLTFQFTHNNAMIVASIQQIGVFVGTSSLKLDKFVIQSSIVNLIVPAI